VPVAERIRFSNPVNRSDPSQVLFELRSYADVGGLWVIGVRYSNDRKAVDPLEVLGVAREQGKVV